MTTAWGYCISYIGGDFEVSHLTMWGDWYQYVSIKNMSFCVDECDLATRKVENCILLHGVWRAILLSKIRILCPELGTLLDSSRWFLLWTILDHSRIISYTCCWTILPIIFESHVRPTFFGEIDLIWLLRPFRYIQKSRKWILYM